MVFLIRTFGTFSVFDSFGFGIQKGGFFVSVSGRKIIKLGSLPKITIVTRNNLFVKIWADCIRSSPKAISSKQAFFNVVFSCFWYFGCCR